MRSVSQLDSNVPIPQGTGEFVGAAVKPTDDQTATTQ